MIFIFSFKIDDYSINNIKGEIDFENNDLEEVIENKYISYQTLDEPSYPVNEDTGNVPDNENLSVDLSKEIKPEFQSLSDNVSGRRIYQCDVCFKQYNKQFKLSNHRNVHTREKEFKCKFCDKVYMFRRSLQLHLKLHENGYKCEVCNENFVQKLKLKRHQIQHMVEKNRQMNNMNQ